MDTAHAQFPTAEMTGAVPLLLAASIHAWKGLPLCKLMSHACCHWFQTLFILFQVLSLLSAVSQFKPLSGLKVAAWMCH